MHRFTDTAGREWPVTMTIGDVRRVRDSLAYDVTKALDGGDQTEKLGDVVFLVDLLFELVRPEAEKRGIDGEQFAEGLNGDVLESAASAMAEALCDFFPKARREIYRRALQAGRQLSETLTSQALAKLSAGDPSTSTPTSGDSPESSDSAPTSSTA